VLDRPLDEDDCTDITSDISMEGLAFAATKVTGLRYDLW